MSKIEMLIEEVKTLPENRVAEVLDFVEFVKLRESQNAEESDDPWFEKGEGCPICAKHRDPKTGEPCYNAETIAAIEEGDAMMRGEIPAKWYNSVEEMLVDLDSDDD